MLTSYILKNYTKQLIINYYYISIKDNTKFVHTRSKVKGTLNGRGPVRSILNSIHVKIRFGFHYILFSYVFFHSFFCQKSFISYDFFTSKSSLLP
jgi:hypothetical protein